MVVEDLCEAVDWGALFQNMDFVVHLAAAVHVGGSAAHDLGNFRATNVVATENLARAAAAAGVSRFVFLSSVKVNGEQTDAEPYRESDPPAPEDAYGRSKQEAEERLAKVARETGMRITVLRPPLVYGPGVKANFAALMRLVASGLPLPFASIKNRRSLIYVGNLVEAIVSSMGSSHSGVQTFLVSDGMPISTPELCRRLALSLGREARLFAFPPTLLEIVPSLRKLTRSLEVNDSLIGRELGWHPPFTLDAGIQATARHYLANIGSPGS